MSHIEDLPSDPYDSSSSSSETQSSSDPESGTSGGGRKHRRTQSQSTQSRSLKQKQKTLLKPIVPLDYDGVADARSYHWFMTEGSDYVVSDHVHR